MKLTVVITMAGLGSRFRKAGYNVPKYMIEVHGKTLFEWSMESLEGYYDKENEYNDDDLTDYCWHRQLRDRPADGHGCE